MNTVVSIKANSKRMASLVLSVSVFLPSLIFSDEVASKMRFAKIGEITAVSDGIKTESFRSISGICCDKEGNIFIADSGRNRIFKFDCFGKLTTSFGAEGQGPGEFLASATNENHLRLSYGNNGQIYVLDPGNQILSAFSTDGIFLRKCRVSKGLYDTAAVNSKGDIYLLSRTGLKSIDCYDKFLKYKTSLLNVDSHLVFPVAKPSFYVLDLRVSNDYEILKMISKRDYLIVVSNYALRAFVFDRNNAEISNFPINRPQFTNDFRQRILKLKDEEKRMQRKLKEGSGTFLMFVLPFVAFLDYEDNIYLYYKTSKMEGEVYEYNMKGDFLGLYAFPEEIDGTCLYAGGQGRIYASRKGKTEIGIYSIPISQKGGKK